MFRTILISTDGSDLATRGVSQGADLARRLGSRVVLVTVTEPWSAPGGIEPVSATIGLSAFTEAMTAQAEDVFKRTRNVVDLAGLDVSTVHVTDSFAAEGIVRVAKEQGADLIVMASHGRRGMGRLLLGSQTVEVLTHTTIPVLVVR